ncbi:hypothetical protein CASFOL_013861 [Castilleja foliolosa]|uniref:VIN3-like protein 2 n=1 Tax=Castilleja foliolosa TaxID=1961234 RepID=A0ABD3DQ88_9LAMI
MDASSLDVLFDPSKCSKLSIDQKRELVYEVSKWSDGATDILHSWTRHDILQVLCAELGKERKYTGLTKSKIIEHLLKIVYEKRSQQDQGTISESKEQKPSSENGERISKRQKKTDNPMTTSAPADVVVYCKNSACKAKMNCEDAFCKRCSCCICRRYDDNKDPSLWLICNSDPPFHGMCCGMSCHLECALRHESSGVSKDDGLDGSYCCVSCGKVNDLLGSCKKQLVVARDTRRVDILCYRLSVAQKILAGTKLYQDLCASIDESVKMLEEEVGPLTGLPVKKARGIVNRLSSGPEIQRLCASAVESLDMMLSERASATPSDCSELIPNLFSIEDLRASSLTVILNYNDLDVGNVEVYVLWHRKADDMEYPSEPTCRLFAPNTKFTLSSLNPATDYFLKAVIFDKDREIGFCEIQFRTGNSEDRSQNPNSSSSEVERSQSPTPNCSSLSNPSSVEDETNNIVPCDDNDKNREGNLLGDNNNDENINCSDNSQKDTNGDVVLSFLDEEQISCVPKSDVLDCTENATSSPRGTGLECVPYVNSLEAGLRMTPCKTETGKNKGTRKNRSKTSGKIEEPQVGSSSKKRSGENRDEECNGIGDKDLEYYVKVIRWLESKGHIETTFRQKFLTWYSLRATSQEVRVVQVFIDTFVEDPESLAEQLIDTFSDVLSSKRCSAVPVGFCLKLWH